MKKSDLVKSKVTGKLYTVVKQKENSAGFICDAIPPESNTYFFFEDEVDVVSDTFENETYKPGTISYKGYEIEPKVVCFDIRYFVWGEGFTFNHYKDVSAAKEAIDKYIAKKYIDKMLEQMSSKEGVSKEVIIQTLREKFEVKK